jgi:hypothetical protein
MAITLSSKTLELIESQMRNLGCANADEFVEKLICDEFPTFEVELRKEIAKLSRAWAGPGRKFEKSFAQSFARGDLWIFTRSSSLLKPVGKLRK